MSALLRENILQWCRENLPQHCLLTWLSIRAPEAASRVEVTMLLRREVPSGHVHHRVQLKVPACRRRMLGDVRQALAWSVAQLLAQSEDV